MENQFQQLRFNISEQVRLQPQQAGIRTLLELDLYPDVGIKDEGQHLKIHGYLRLHGQYLGDQLEYAEEDEATSLQSEEIAYVIPVEITLPREKAAIEYIQAEVESFDYTIKSEFELEIDAVLAIDGILPEETEEVLDVAEESYETPAVDEQADAALNEPQDENNEEQYLEIQSEEPSASEEKKEEGKLKEREEEKETVLEEQLQLIESEEEKPPLKQTKTEQEDFTAPEQAVHFEEEQEIKPVDVPVNIEPKREEQMLEPDLKIEAEKTEEAVVEQEEEVVTEEAEGEEEHAEQEEHAFDEQIEQSEQGQQWYGWLIHEEEGATFTPLRMVIVQQDDTIDNLASRYQVSANQLIELNNLESDRVESGQIIKIPNVEHVGSAEVK